MRIKEKLLRGPIVITKSPVDVILLRGPLEGPGPKARLEEENQMTYEIIMF